jgi:hypothetical protein
MYDSCLDSFFAPFRGGENKKELTSCLDSFAPFRVGKQKKIN